MQPARGGMSSKVVAEFTETEITAMQSTLTGENSKLSALRANKRTLEIQVSIDSYIENIALISFGLTSTE
jgi:hypothetical protein